MKVIGIKEMIEILKCFLTGLLIVLSIFAIIIFSALFWKIASIILGVILITLLGCCIRQLCL